MSTRIAIGVGCRRGCPADAIEALVHQALGLLPAAVQPGSPAQRSVKLYEPAIQDAVSWFSIACLPTRPVAACDELGSQDASASRQKKCVVGEVATQGPVALFSVACWSRRFGASCADPTGQHAGLFTIEDKIGETGLAQAAGRLGLDLVFLTRDALREQTAFVQTRSLRAERRFGVAAVAEAAALAGAGAGAILIVPRLAGNGATCAIAGPAS